MKCPECGSDSCVTNTRKIDDGATIYRRRVCLARVPHSWTTAEVSLKRLRNLEAIADAVASASPSD